MKIKKVFASLFSLMGIAAPMTAYAQQVESVVEDSPIILQHRQDFNDSRASLMDSLKVPEKELTYHSSHYSHTSHRSHHSHYSSR